MTSLWMNVPYCVVEIWANIIYGWCTFGRFWCSTSILMLFSTTMVDGWGCFCAKQHLLKKCFWRVAEFDVEWWSWIFHLHGNLKFLLLSSHVHARQQTPNLFQPSFISTTTLWTRSLWDCFSFCCMWVTGNDGFAEWSVYFKQRLHGRIFPQRMDDFTLEFDAPARCMSTRMRETKQHGTAADK